MADETGESNTTQGDKVGLHATWSMAVGGMVGGGIFSVLGTAVATAGAWAWLSFLIAGLIALATGFVNAHLSASYREGGGAFIFLRRENQHTFAGNLSWVLLIAYILANAVYSFTFGNYLCQTLGWEHPVASKAVALVALLILMALNYRGVCESAEFEIAAVWAKLAVLCGLGVAGLWHWAPEQLGAGLEPPDSTLTAVFLGAASIFVAYEGFEMLAYNYDEIHRPRQTLRRSMPLAIVCVMAVYLLVYFGSTFILGADQVVEHKDTALLEAGRQLMGEWGAWIVCIGALLSSGSAINATLFATARLSQTVSEECELPEAVADENRHGIPHRALYFIVGATAVVVGVGNLEAVVLVASLVFLYLFVIINGLGVHRLVGFWRLLASVAMLASVAAAATLTAQLVFNQPLIVFFLVVVIVLVTLLRPYVLSNTQTVCK